MATVYQQQGLGQGTPRTPDALPIGADNMMWGQDAVRYMLPDQARINSVLKVHGYKNPRVLEVIVELLNRINGDPTSKEPDLWRYQPEGEGTAGTLLRALAPGVLIVTTIPHRTTNWELSVGKRIDTDAATEYSTLYGSERPGYKFKMVMFDPEPGDDKVGELDRLVRVTQADRKLPWLGLREQAWRLKEYASRWAIIYSAEKTGISDASIQLDHPDGSRTTELYRIPPREPGKIRIATRLVNVHPSVRR